MGKVIDHGAVSQFQDSPFIELQRKTTPIYYIPMFDIFIGSNISLRQLHQFAAVAEELHFGRAAERLNMTQPPLSMAIRSLETALEVKLLDRNNRHVTLTSAGETFLAEIERLEELLERCVTRTRRVAAGEEGEVRLGVLSASGYLPPVIRAVRKARPGLSIEIVEATTAEQIQMLAEGRIDAGLVRPPLSSPDNLEHHVIARQRLVAVVPSDHPLADLPAVPIAAFENEPFIGTPTDNVNGLHGRIVALTETAGFELSVVQIVKETATATALVASGIGVSILPESGSLSRYPGVEVRPLGCAPGGPLPDIPMWLAWLATNRQEPFQGFLATVRQAFPGPEHGGGLS